MITILTQFYLLSRRSSGLSKSQTHHKMLRSSSEVGYVARLRRLRQTHVEALRRGAFGGLARRRAAVVEDTGGRRARRAGGRKRSRSRRRARRRGRRRASQDALRIESLHGRAPAADLFGLGTNLAGSSRRQSLRGRSPMRVFRSRRR